MIRTNLLTTILYEGTAEDNKSEVLRVETKDQGNGVHVVLTSIKEKATTYIGFFPPDVQRGRDARTVLLESSETALMAHFDRFNGLYHKLDQTTLTQQLKDALTGSEFFQGLYPPEEAQYLEACERAGFSPTLAILQLGHNDLMTKIHGGNWAQTSAALYCGKHPEYLNLVSILPEMKVLLA